MDQEWFTKKKKKKERENKKKTQKNKKGKQYFSVFIFVDYLSPPAVKCAQHNI